MNLWAVSTIMAPNLFLHKAVPSKLPVDGQEKGQAERAADIMRLLIRYQDLLWTVRTPSIRVLLHLKPNRLFWYLHYYSQLDMRPGENILNNVLRQICSIYTILLFVLCRCQISWWVRWESWTRTAADAISSTTSASRTCWRRSTRTAKKNPTKTQPMWVRQKETGELETRDSCWQIASVRGLRDRSDPFIGFISERHLAWESHDRAEVLR